MPHPTSSRLSSLALREAADFGASLRRPDGLEPGPQFIVTRFDETDREWRMRRIDIADDIETTEGLEGVGIPVDTWMLQPNRLQVKDATMAFTGGTLCLKDYDAIFWSEAAVEKFVMTYYASKYQWAAAHILSVITEKFYGYVPNPAGDNRPPQQEETEPGHHLYPFAIGHLPRSDYATIDQPDEEEKEYRLGDELHFLYRDATGTITSIPLSDCLKADRG